MFDPLTDERIEAFQANKLEGFANWAVMWDEIRRMAQEIKYYRDKPLHCPGCDGDQL